MEMFKPGTACVFLPQRYGLPSVTGNALRTIIQKPISLASPMLHAAPTVTDICVLNKSFFTLNMLGCCFMISTLRKSGLPGCTDEDVQYVFLRTFISCVLECHLFRKPSFIFLLMVHYLSEEKGPFNFEQKAKLGT